MSVVLLHGAGSSGRAAAALLGSALDAHAPVTAVEDRSGQVDALVDSLDAACASTTVAAGVSLGAHALARWAGRTGVGTPLVLILPAWTGAPGSVAELTAMSADVIAREGVEAALARMRSTAAPRDRDLIDIIGMGWSTYDVDVLTRVLRTAAQQPGPSVAELSAIEAPCAVVSWPDDPLHPRSVAEEWSRHIRGSTVHCAADRTPQDLAAAVHMALASVLG